MNPMITAISSHMDKGNEPVNFFSAYPQDETRYGVEVWLENGRQIHDLQPKDHQEFLRWVKETESWWGRKTKEDLRRIG